MYMQVNCYDIVSVSMGLCTRVRTDEHSFTTSDDHYQAALLTAV